MTMGLTVLFGAVTLIGVYLTWRSMKREKPRRFSWSDIHQGVADLLQQVKGQRWAPDILVTVTGSGGIMANLFTKLADERKPLYTVMLEDPRDGWDYTPPLHQKHPAGRWLINVPDALLEEDREKAVLILDSSSFSGVAMDTIRRILKAAGFKDVKYGSFVQVERPQGPSTQPDICAHRTSEAVFYYPWGRG